METTGQANAAREKIAGDMKSVISDAEEFLRTTQQQANEGFLAARAKFEESLGVAREELIRFEENMVARTKEAAIATDQYVREHPWQSVGLGACIGMIAGLLIARR